MKEQTKKYSIAEGDALKVFRGVRTKKLEKAVDLLLFETFF